MKQDEARLDHGFERTTEVESDESVMERGERLTPVSEAIRYRKRAQAAEKQVVELSSQLEQRETENGATQERLTALQQENSLTRHLVQAGATDVEVTLLLAKQKLDEKDTSEKAIKDAVENTREERPYLFGQITSDGTGRVSAGLRPGPMGRRESLQQQAQKTMNSNSRQDMQEYLRLRRSVQV